MEKYDLEKNDQQVHENAVKDWWNLSLNAKKWDGLTYNKEFETHLHYWIRQKKTLEFLDNLKLEKNSNILELGFGGGETAEKILEKGFNYYGIDISDQLCSQATKKYSKYVESGKAKFIAGSLEKDFPFKENFFDLVIICGAIHYAGNLTKSFNEVKRVLKNNSYYIIGQGNMYTLNDLIVPRKFLKCLIWFFTKENFMHSYSLSYRDMIFESKLAKFFLKYKDSRFMNSSFMTNKSNKWKYKIHKRLFSLSRLKKMVQKYNFKILRISGGPFLYNSENKTSIIKKYLNLILQKILDTKILPILILIADNIVILTKIKK